MYRVVLLLAALVLAGCARQDTAMLEARVQVRADVPVDAAWTLLSDFSLAHNYVPGLSRTEIVSAQTQGVGTHRRVYDADGDYIEETITEWHEGRGFTIRLHEGDAPMTPFEQVLFDYRLDPAAGDATAEEIPVGVVTATTRSPGDADELTVIPTATSVPVSLTLGKLARVMPSPGVIVTACSCCKCAPRIVSPAVTPRWRVIGSTLLIVGSCPPT